MEKLGMAVLANIRDEWSSVKKVNDILLKKRFVKCK